MKTFQKRDIEVVFQLHAGSFGNDADEVRIKGLRVLANVQYTPQSWSSAIIQIYGLSQDVIKRLLMLKFRKDGNVLDANTVRLQYTDDTVHTLFQGGIQTAMMDYNQMPNAPLVVEAMGSLAAQMTVTDPICFQGTWQVSAIMQELAKSAGLTLINAGVETTLEDETVNGSVQDMIDRVSRDANIVTYVENDHLIIAPQSTYRSDLPIIKVSRETGLIGAPVPTDYGVIFTHLYTPQFGMLRPVQIVFPDFPFAEGIYYCTDIRHYLDSEMPNGRWHSQIVAQWRPK